jgi:lactoylglutathione lyase
MEIDYIALFVSDVSHSVAFYRDILGFEFSKPLKDSGCEGRSGSLKIGIYDRAWLSELFSGGTHPERNRIQPPISGNPFLLSMTVNDLDTIYQDLIKKHVNVLKPPTQMPWGQKILFLTDPDNNLLEIVQKSPNP